MVTDSMLAYLSLLKKWNAVYNLTAIRDLNDMRSRHLLDSLAILPWIKENRILDVGTGPGLPGIPLALARPSFQVTLLDSNGKKVRFLREVQRQLKIANIEIVQSRLEDYQPSVKFDTIITRAVGEISLLIEYTQEMIAKEGLWLAMKGQVPVAELKRLSHPYFVEEYTLDDRVGKRCCVIVKNKKNS